MVGNSVDTEFLRLISGTHQIRTAFERAGLQQNDEAAWIVYLPEFGSDDPFESQKETGIKIPRDTYNSASQEANRLKLHLNAELITQRPIPTMDGLERLGFESEIANSTPKDLESAFLLHAAMSDLNT